MQRPADQTGPLALFEIVSRAHTHDAWVHINPLFASTLRLAITSRMVFAEGDMAQIVREYRGGFWLGPDNEAWYTLACRCGHPSAMVSVEKWMGREPFLLDGERIWVGKHIEWEGKHWRCTSIDKDFVRVKRDEADATATLMQIPRANLEEKIAVDKAAEKAKRAAEREANRPDPVVLLPLAEHISQEIARYAHRRWGRERGVSICHVPDWVKGHGTDYRAAWKACEDGYHLGEYLVWIGLVRESPRGDADTIRKRHSWPKVEAQIFRFVREARGLPLRDPVAEAAR